jgi:hypothetical protein
MHRPDRPATLGPPGSIKEDVMSDTTAGPEAAREVAELAALVRGREDDGTTSRLEEIAGRLRAGAVLDEDDEALLGRVRHRYARELGELEHPEPW